MTNRGLSLKLRAVPWGPDTYVARLNCTYEQQYTKCLGIFLRRLDEDDQYARVGGSGRSIVVWPRSRWDNGTSRTPMSGKSRGLIAVNVRQNIAASDTNVFKKRVNGFRIHRELLHRDDFIRTKLVRGQKKLRSHDKLYAIVQDGWERTNPENSRHFRLFRPLLLRTDRGQQAKIMVLGFHFDHSPVCFMGEVSSEYEMGRIENFEKWLFKESYYHHDIINCDWSKIRGGKAQELYHRHNVWALKGDRIEGLQVSVEDFGLLQISRKEIEGDRLVWDVSIVDESELTDMEHRDPTESS